MEDCHQVLVLWTITMIVYRNMGSASIIPAQATTTANFRPAMSLGETALE